jgi:hypothetical protein
VAVGSQRLAINPSLGNSIGNLRDQDRPCCRS